MNSGVLVYKKAKPEGELRAEAGSQDQSCALTLDLTRPAGEGIVVGGIRLFCDVGAVTWDGFGCTRKSESSKARWGTSLKMYWPGESVSRRSNIPFMPRLETVRGGSMSEARISVAMV